MKKKTKKEHIPFYVINEKMYQQNSFGPYNVMPYLIEAYESTKKNKHIQTPVTFDEFKDFVKQIDDYFDNITESQLEQDLKDIGIDDPQQFDKEIEDLKSKTRTEEESNKLSELLQKQEKYNKLHFEMFNDEAKIDELKPITYEDWHILRNENKPKKDGDLDPLNNYTESLLENVLWVAPKDEE